MTPLTSSASTVLGVGVTSDTRSLMEMRSLVDWTVRPHLLSVAGVADVNVFGGEVRQWQVQVDPQRLVTLGLAVQDVLAGVRGAAGILGTGFIEGAESAHRHLGGGPAAQSAGAGGCGGGHARGPPDPGG